MEQVKEVIVRQPDYLRAADAVLAATAYRHWKEYLTFGLLSSLRRRSARRIRRGAVRVQREDHRRSAADAAAVEARRRGSRESTLGEPVGRLYVDRYFKAERRRGWTRSSGTCSPHSRSASTNSSGCRRKRKLQAQAKLAKYSLKIGYPDKLAGLLGARGEGRRPGRQRDALPRIPAGGRRGRASASLWSAGAGDSPRRRSTRRTTPSNNEITFPAGILQPPFFDVDADDAVNYGAIGSVIGHEISHGFDNQGRKSDGDGNLRDWWTAADAQAVRGARHEARRAVSSAYDAAARHEDQRAADDGREHRRPERTGGGLSRVQDLAQREEAPVIGGFSGDQRFFLGFAQIWRFKSRDEALRNQLLTDPHSPGMFRAFVPLTNIDAFYAAFDLKPGDKLYRPPSERVKIW